MRKLDDEHQRWYQKCPNLPFSYCANLIITLLFIIFLPAVLLIVPLIAILWFTIILTPKYVHRVSGGTGCCGKVAIRLACILILMPLALVFGMAIVAILAAIAIIPLYLLSISFLVRLIYIGCKTKI